MHSVGTPTLWAIFVVTIIIMLCVDILSQNTQKENEISLRYASAWSFIWVVVALFFALGLWFYLKQTTNIVIANHKTISFLTGYLLEKILAIDNVFIWLTLFNYFAIPVNLQRTVCIYGVIGAITLRAVIIFMGSWFVLRFYWIMYFFGFFLLFTGIKMFFVKKENHFFNRKLLTKWLYSNLHITSTLHDKHFFIRRDGIILFTPLSLALILIEISDIIFAVDSIPAIFAIITDPFIVLTSNIFAVLGLRAMFFVLSFFIKKFFMLKYTLSIILIFIGAKMLLINILHISIITLFTIVMSILLLTVIINYFFYKDKQHD